MGPGSGAQGGPGHHAAPRISWRKQQQQLAGAGGGALQQLAGAGTAAGAGAGAGAGVRVDQLPGGCWVTLSGARHVHTHGHEVEWYRRWVGWYRMWVGYRRCAQVVPSVGGVVPHGGGYRTCAQVLPCEVQVVQHEVRVVPKFAAV